MNAIPRPEAVADFIKHEFMVRGKIRVLDIIVRAYPEEINYIVYVDETDLLRAAKIGNELDDEVSSTELQAFVVVRKASKDLTASKGYAPLTAGVKDERASELIRLISARSRVSEAQPSLSYIRDVRYNLSAVTAGRHHLIFGRRGAGKTALLVEAKRRITNDGHLSCWINMQTLRRESPPRVFLYVLDEVLRTVVARQQHYRPDSVVSAVAAELYEQVRRLLAGATTEQAMADLLIPRVQGLLRRFLEQEARHLYIFIDDFYFLPRAHQPQVLDMLNSCVRDCEAWLKVASIRHLTRWFQSSPPMGLQTIQDADLITLDVTLQDPRGAKTFLESILHEYCRTVEIGSLTKIFHGNALDRLVLASGAVPRDYLVLASNAILSAQHRQKARLVGAQDVNQAAGDAVQGKIQELEEDMASDVESARRTIGALNIVRRFCLDEHSHTYFLVDYRDKEANPRQYNVLTDLMSVRLIHLIDAGVSHAHAAGQKYEAFMLDLSQYSGLRLKHRIQVLDFSGGRIVSRRTRVAGERRVGDTARQVVQILRGAPTLRLELFEPVSGQDSDS